MFNFGTCLPSVLSGVALAKSEVLTKDGCRWPMFSPSTCGWGILFVPPQSIHKGLNFFYIKAAWETAGLF